MFALLKIVLSFKSDKLGINILFLDKNRLVSFLSRMIVATLWELNVTATRSRTVSGKS